MYFCTKNFFRTSFKKTIKRIIIFNLGPSNIIKKVTVFYLPIDRKRIVTERVRQGERVVEREVQRK